MVLEFRGQPAAKVMFEVLEAMDEGDRKLFQNGAFIGRAVDPAQSTFRPGDLLVRNVMGIEPQRHALAIADDGLRAGVTLQLMVRDAPSGSAELESVLDLAGLETAGAAFGGLAFTCAGRGPGDVRRARPRRRGHRAPLRPGLPPRGLLRQR